MLRLFFSELIISGLLQGALEPVKKNILNEWLLKIDCSDVL